MKKCCCILFVFLPLLSVAQVDTSKFSISLHSNFEGNSNSLPNTILAKLLWGGFMSKDFLTEVRDNLNVQNRFGFEFKNEASFKWKAGRKHWVVGVGYRELLGFDFPKDMFGFVFLGNAAYEGKTANLSKIQFEYVQYSKASFGIEKALKKGKNGVLFGAVSILHGFNYQSIKTNEASIYTAPNGEFVQSEGNLALHYRQLGYGGWGSALDVQYRIEKGNHRAFVSLQDFGFLYWASAARFEGNSNYTLRGEEIQDISNYNGDSLFVDYSTRGFAKRFGIQESTVNYTSLTPFSLKLKYEYSWSCKYKSTIESYYTHVASFVPRSALKTTKSMGKWDVMLGLAYGGFGRENLLFGIGKSFAKKWQANVEGYFLGMATRPAHSHGIGLNFALKKAF
jgi:hypothetical protein